VGAVIYLAVFGSIVGYSAYIYALGKLPVSLFSVYPYVNAVVAVLLGWLVYSEPLGWRELLAMCTIFVGVGIVKWQAGSNAHRVSQAAGAVPADV
jgi:drug/metabolite transporter (DMT)-like permease